MPRLRRSDRNIATLQAHRLRPNTLLPPEYDLGHWLSFEHHDILAQLLVSGERAGAYSQSVKVPEGVAPPASPASGEEVDILEWMRTAGLHEDRVAFLVRTVLPALLSEFLHFIYEALETSRKAKLSVSYTLLRKPLQELLAVIEAIAIDPQQFADDFERNLQRLEAGKAGGVDAHAQRIARVLQVIDQGDLYDAAYLAQLRHDKNANDGFDGTSNRAVHLITSHKAIPTEPLNFNFIFSDWNSKASQWAFLYSRLPYILSYTRHVVEHVYSRFRSTDPVYLADTERRIWAGTAIWHASLEDDYRSHPIERYCAESRRRLLQACAQGGWGEPQADDLLRMSVAGAWPGESSVKVRLRASRYAANIRLERLLSE